MKTAKKTFETAWSSLMRVSKTIVFLSVVVSLWIASPAFSSSAVNKLNRDLSSLSSNIGKFIEAGTRADVTLTYLKGKLEIPSKISSDLGQLHEMMMTTKSLLTVAEVVPQFHSAAANLKEGIDSFDPSVTRVKSQIDEVDNKLKPVKKAVKKMDKGVKQIDADLLKFQSDIGKVMRTINTEQTCIDSMPDGPDKQQAQTALDQFANNLDTSVVQLNSVLQTIIQNINQVIQTVKNDLKTALDTLSTIEKSVESLDESFANMQKPLHNLNNLMNTYFSIKFPYPNPTWKNPFRVSHYTLRISMKVIIKGSEAIEKEIKRKLSTALYDAAKAFGLQKIVNYLEEAPQREMRRIASQLVLDIETNIPGFNQLDSTLNKIEATMESLEPKMKINTSSVENLISQLTRDYQDMQKICKK